MAIQTCHNRGADNVSKTIITIVAAIIPSGNVHACGVRKPRLGL
jgi:hypothetical protein